MREKEFEEIHCKLWDKNLRFSLICAFVAICCMYFDFIEMAAFFWVIFLTMSNFQMVRQGHKDDICLYQRSAELMKKSDICKKLLYGNEKTEAFFLKKQSYAFLTIAI